MPPFDVRERKKKDPKVAQQPQTASNTITHGPNNQTEETKQDSTITEAPEEEGPMMAPANKFRFFLALLALVFSVAGRKLTGWMTTQLLDKIAEEKKVKNGTCASPALPNVLESLRPAGKHVCRNPSDWLNRADAYVLEEKDSGERFGGYESYNESMMWGTYMPSMYFGFRTRTAPLTCAGGLMWGKGDNDLRHEARESDKLESYGWDIHDGRSYGQQTIKDLKNNMILTTSMVKPRALDIATGFAEAHDVNNVHIALRVRAEAAEDNLNSLKNTAVLYLYFGLDCDGALDSINCLASAESQGFTLTEMSTEDNQRHQWQATGSTSSLGPLTVDAICKNCASMSQEEDPSSTCTAGILGGAALADAQTHIKSMFRPSAVNKKENINGNFVAIRLAGQLPLQMDLIIRRQTDASNIHTHTNIENIADLWFEKGHKQAESRMLNSFGGALKHIEEKDSSIHTSIDTHIDTHVHASLDINIHTRKSALAALSNLLGSMGYFYGESTIAPGGGWQETLKSFPVRLFTCVPSRSFFPRGFLWDEGFHQLVAMQYDAEISIDVISHWLGLMHVHTNSELCPGGWIPREQILGTKAKARVPAEFIPQGVDVANPPSLFLAVQALLNRAKAERGTDMSTKIFAFLRASMNPLDLWAKWLLATQRSAVSASDNITEASASEEENPPLPPLGAFQWQGRNPNEDKLNPTTMASGLDDYPRASHPSTHEYHVDGLSWMVLVMQVMADLNDEFGISSECTEGSSAIPYRQLASELADLLDTIHWSDAHQAYLDVGLHAAAKENVPGGGVVTEIIISCSNGEATRDVAIPAAIFSPEYKDLFCPKEYPNFRHPLPDGRGGYMKRDRWWGEEPPKVQFIHHIGYVSLFPFLLGLLSPTNAHLIPILDTLINPSWGLWSEYGIRSLSTIDPFYQKANNPGDEPYWRGHIWINMNYLACRALRHYSLLDGPAQETAATAYIQLRQNVLNTVMKEYARTGFFWEQYDDRTGKGIRSHPFNGWTSTIVNILTEQY